MISSTLCVGANPVFTRSMFANSTYGLASEKVFSVSLPYLVTRFCHIVLRNALSALPKKRGRQFIGKHKTHPYFLPLHTPAHGGDPVRHGYRSRSPSRHRPIQRWVCQPQERYRKSVPCPCCVHGRLLCAPTLLPVPVARQSLQGRQRSFPTAP